MRRASVSSLTGQAISSSRGTITHPCTRYGAQPDKSNNNKLDAGGGRISCHAKSAQATTFGTQAFAAGSVIGPDKGVGPTKPDDP